MKDFFNTKISIKFDIDQKIERICVVTGKYEKLDSLIKKKHSISHLKFDGWSPLQSASFNMHINVVKYLLKNALVPLDIRDEMGCTALHLATWRGSEQITQALLNSNPKYEPLTYKKYNHVHFAIFGGHIKIVKSLSKYGKKPFETPNEDGITPFILACKIGRLDIVKYLYTTYKFNVNHMDNYQCTALHHACWEGHPKIVEFLIKNHANTQIINFNSQQPIDTCQTIEMRNFVLETIKRYERGDPEPIFSIDTAPPPIPQELFSQDHDRYLNIIQQLRDFVNSMIVVGKGIEIIESNIASIEIDNHNYNNENKNEYKNENNYSNNNENQNLVRRNSSASISLFDEIKNEFDQNYISESLNSEDKAESTTPPRRPSIVLTSTSSSNDANAPARSFSLVLSNIIPDIIPIESNESKDDRDNNSIINEDIILNEKLSNNNNDDNHIDVNSNNSNVSNNNEITNNIENHSNIQVELTSGNEIISSTSISNIENDSLPPTSTLSLLFDPSTTINTSITSTTISSPLSNISSIPSPSLNLNVNNSKSQISKLTQREILNQLNNPIPSDGVQSLVWSICKRTGDITALTNLIQRHPEVLHENIRDSTGLTPLQCAISHEYIEIVQYLLERGLYVNINDKLGNTPFHQACVIGNVNIIQLFLNFQNKLNLWTQNDNGETVLHIVSSRGDLNIFQLLVKNETTQLDVINNNGNKALELAEMNHHNHIVDYIMKLKNPLITQPNDISGDNNNYNNDEVKKDVNINVDTNTDKISSLEQSTQDFIGDIIINENGEYYLGITKRPEYIEQSSLVEDENDDENDEYEDINIEKIDQNNDDDDDDDDIDIEESVQNENIMNLETLNIESNLSIENTSLPINPIPDTSMTNNVITIEDIDNTSYEPTNIEICNGVVFQEIFEDEDSDEDNNSNHDNNNNNNNNEENEMFVNNFNNNQNEIDQLKNIESIVENNQLENSQNDIIPNMFEVANSHSLGTNNEIVNIENRSTLSSDGFDITNNQQLIVIDTSPSYEENSQKTINVNWLPFIISISKLFGLKQGQSLSRCFFHWKYETFFYHFHQKILHSPIYMFGIKTFLKIIKKYYERVLIFGAWKLWIHLPSKSISKSITLSPQLPQSQIDIETNEINELSIGNITTNKSLLNINEDNIEAIEQIAEQEFQLKEKEVIEEKEEGKIENEEEIKVNHIELNMEETVQNHNQDQEIERIKSHNSPKNNNKILSLEIVNTPLPSDENVSLSLEMITATPPTEGRIAQKLRFNDVVNITIVENLNEPEEEEDLTLLGPLPIDLLPLFKLNEHVLWELLTFYVTNKLSLPSSKTEEKKRITKRIVSSASLWNLLSDFSVCPSVCSKASLKNIIDSLLNPPHLPTIYCSSSHPLPKIKANDPVVSFLGFQKVLWAIARDCLDAPSATDPISRLLSLFSRLDSSPGRKKMASHPRYSHVLPPFILGDSASKRQYHTKEGRKETSPNRRHSDSGKQLTTSPITPTSPQITTTLSSSIPVSIPKSALITSSSPSTSPSTPSTPSTPILNNTNKISTSIKSNKSIPQPHPTITSCITPFGGLGASNTVVKNKSAIPIKKELEKIESNDSINKFSPEKNINIIQTQDSLELSPNFDSDIVKEISSFPIINSNSNQKSDNNNNNNNNNNSGNKNNLNINVNNSTDITNNISLNPSLKTSLEDNITEDRILPPTLIDEVKIRIDSPNSKNNETNIIDNQIVIQSNQIKVDNIKQDIVPTVEVNFIESPKNLPNSSINIIPEPTLLQKDKNSIENEYKDNVDNDNYLDQNNQNNQSKFTINISIDEHVINNPTPTRPGLPPLSPWSSSRQIVKQHYDSDNSVVSISPEPPLIPDNTLEELTKVPIADRVNAKLAAKQFEALVTKIKTDSARGLSPGRERLSPKIASNPPDYDSNRETNNINHNITKTRKLPMPLRRNQSERSYTESIWLNNNNDNGNGNTENIDDNNNNNTVKLNNEIVTNEPPRRPPAPLMRRSSEKASQGTTIWANNKSDSSHTDNTQRNEHSTVDIPERPKTPNGTPSRREMWGQASNDEGKLQGALSLWRRSARDFNRSDGEQDTNNNNQINMNNNNNNNNNNNEINHNSNININEINTSNDIDSGNEGSQKNYLSDGEFASDTDYPLAPSPRNRKRRGSVTRRR